MTEKSPRILEEPVLENYPVSHEALVAKLDSIVELVPEYTDSRGEAQKLTATFIPGSGMSKETVIINTPWSDSADRDFNILRHAALAEHTGADVIIIGFPGHDVSTDGKLTELQMAHLSKDSPSFSEVGKALASAVDQISNIDQIPNGYWSDREVTLAGYSQGASSQIGMLEHLNEDVAKNITDLFIWESPDMLESQKKSDVAKKFIQDGNKAKRYLEENEQVFGEENAKESKINDRGLIGLGSFALRMTKKTGQLLTGSIDAMAGSTLERDLKKTSDRLENVRIHVINGGDSIVSPPEQGEKLVNAIIKGTSGPSEVNHFSRESDSHPAQESFARYSSTVKDIKEK